MTSAYIQKHTYSNKISYKYIYKQIYNNSKKL